MAEDLTKLWGSLSLNEGEIEDVTIQPDSVEGLVFRGKFCLVGKLLADRYVGKDVIKREMKKGWRPTRRVDFKVVGENLFLLEFEDEDDKRRVLKGRPWIFEDSLFSVKDFDGLSTLSETSFERAEFWVRMFNLPLACMGKEVGFQIGSTMGTVTEVETDDDGVGWGKYLRVRINLDLTKPLARGRTINLFGKKVLITFQYKKLPRYCFDCGKIWHGGNGCSQMSGRSKLESGQQYGTWLRVPSPWRRGDQTRSRWHSDAKKEWGKTPNLASRENYSQSEGSRNSGGGGDTSFPSSENQSIPEDVAANGMTAVAEEPNVTRRDLTVETAQIMAKNQGNIFLKRIPI
jgi:hypothetical protein